MMALPRDVNAAEPVGSADPSDAAFTRSDRKAFGISSAWSGVSHSFSASWRGCHAPDADAWDPV
jgi:hypothetical protein